MKKEIDIVSCSSVIKMLHNLLVLLNKRDDKGLTDKLGERK